MKQSIARAFAAALALTGAIASAPALADGPPPLVTVLSEQEPQTQLMSMVLSMQALQQGSQVSVLLCGPGGDLALKQPPAASTAPQKPKGMSPHGLLKTLIAKGASVEVCAIYLPNKGVGPEALLEGVAPAKPPAMAAKLLADDARILSF